MGTGTKGFDLKLFHQQVGYEGIDGGTHGSTMDLFIKLIFEEEVGAFKTELKKVTICWMDMLDLWGKVESCANLCWTIWMEGSTGTAEKGL